MATTVRPAIEITTFKLAGGLQLADFIAANADVDPWLRRQRGFVSRMLLQKPDGTVVDWWSGSGWPTPGPPPDA